MTEVQIKTAQDIEKMRVAGQLAADVLDMITPYVQPDITTDELDKICHHYIVHEQQAIPAPLNYGGGGGRRPFPKSICTSLNEVVCHGIPSEKRKLKVGDVLNIDVTVIKDGYHGDTSKMFMVGQIQPFAQRLSIVTQECMYKGIEVVKPGAKLSDIGRAIQHHAHIHHYSVVEDYCGHGIGKVFHEPPQILHYYASHMPDLVLEPGMIFTVEPMINAGRKETKLKSDGWTAVTKDRRLSAQWEHTIVVTQTGVEIFTLRSEETIPFELTRFEG